MNATAATADTREALRAALDAAHREREALAEQLAAIDQLIGDLDEVVSGADTRPARGRTAAKRSTRKTAGKRSTRKAAGRRSTKKATAKRSVRKAAAKRGTKKATRKAAAKRAGQRQGAGRTDRVVEIVRSSSEPLSTGDVRARLAQSEPDVSSKLVSAALTYAQRKGRVRRADGGRWTGA